MKRRVTIFAGLAAACLILLSAPGCTGAGRGDPPDAFETYLEEKGFSYSGDTCSTQSRIEEGSVTHTYTETFNFKDHTLTASFVRYDSAASVTSEMEYVYNYENDTVIVNRYDTQEACEKRQPDAVYTLNREDIVECTYGEETVSETELYNQIHDFKKAFETYLEEAGVTLQDMIG